MTMDPRAQAPDVVKNAEMQRYIVRVANAMGFLCALPWSRSLSAATRSVVLRERARGLTLHDLAICREVQRLKIRLMALQAKAVLDARESGNEK